MSHEPAHESPAHAAPAHHAAAEHHGEAEHGGAGISAHGAIPGVASGGGDDAPLTASELAFGAKVACALHPEQQQQDNADPVPGPRRHAWSDPKRPQADRGSAREAARYVDREAYDVNAQGRHIKLTKRERQAVIYAVSHYSTSNIKKLEHANIGLELAGPNTPAADLPDGNPWPKANDGTPAGGVYYTGQHAITSLQSYADEKNQTNRDDDTTFVVTHEVAHALDNIRGGTDLATANDPKFQTLYQQYVAETAKDGHGHYLQKDGAKHVIDPDANNYAATASAELFAEGGREYVTNPSQLRRADPALYAYEQQYIGNDHHAKHKKR